MGALTILMMSVLPASFIAYAVGILFIRKLKLTKLALISGFFVTWLMTALFSLALADKPTADSASKSAISSAFAASFFGVSGLALTGNRRK
ncbi:hypothetical protein [Methylomonas sp. UP202]|uniref:hypothetical protein n=1 Tax=Methylomonas sp. UP202 TaxID=3040943 RepID=UPI00247ABC8D|nr:hypothetical protein [Methylomonas sp. UP202]WGS85830.1 hypothetical protein QC632_22790 [Methylomonas sp. UP202]